MYTQIELMQRLVEESEVSNDECAALTVLLQQMQFYVAKKAEQGDLYAQNICKQITKEKIYA